MNIEKSSKRNRITLFFWRGLGHHPQDEVSVELRTIEDLPWDTQQVEEIDEAIQIFLDDFELDEEVLYEVRFEQFVEYDGAGAITERYWGHTKTNIIDPKSLCG